MHYILTILNFKIIDYIHVLRAVVHPVIIALRVVSCNLLKSAEIRQNLHSGC
jgi:hypothetical protein